MEFGNRRFIFHPGYPGGAFRIEDATLATHLLENLDMGFTPSTTAFHTMQLFWDDAAGELTVTVLDGDGIADPFALLWEPDAGFDPGGRIGFTYHNGGGDPGIAAFDNLTIVPEPSSFSLLSLGLVGLATSRARWKRHPSGRRSKLVGVSGQGRRLLRCRAQEAK
jgi:hypothetical protein